MDATAPIKVTRIESATGWSEFSQRDPDPRLASLVSGFCGYRERSQVILRRREPATSRIPVILSFGDPIDILDLPDAGAFQSFVAGFHPGPATTQHDGAQFGLQFDLTPLGAYRILGRPGSELAGHVVPFSDIAPRVAASLPDRLASLPTWSDRFALLDDVLMAMADAGPAPDPIVSWLWRQLGSSAGQARISDLVAESGRSHRHVASRFREQVGLAPKAAASVVRFEHAARAVSSGHDPLADVAATYGYADQSHLTREFVRLAGCTPAAFVRLDQDSLTKAR